MEELVNILSKFFYTDINSLIISLLYNKCEKCNMYKEDVSETYEHKYICDDCVKIYIYKECNECKLQYDFLDGDFCSSCRTCCQYYCDNCLVEQLRILSKWERG